MSERSSERVAQRSAFVFKSRSFYPPDQPHSPSLTSKPKLSASQLASHGKGAQSFGSVGNIRTGFRPLPSPSRTRPIFAGLSEGLTDYFPDNASSSGFSTFAAPAATVELSPQRPPTYHDLAHLNQPFSASLSLSEVLEARQFTLPARPPSRRRRRSPLDPNQTVAVSPVRKHRSPTRRHKNGGKRRGRSTDPRRPRLTSANLSAYDAKQVLQRVSQKLLQLPRRRSKSLDFSSEKEYSPGSMSISPHLAEKMEALLQV